jgi:hypothetical protein
MSQEQKSCFDTGLKIIAVVMVVGLIVSMPIALAGRSFGRVIFRPSVLTSVLRDSLLGSGAMEGFLQGTILTSEIFETLSGGEDEIGRYFEYLSPGEREEILLALLPPNWIEDQFSQGIRDFFAWLDDDRAYPKLALNIKPLKAQLLRGGINTFVDVVVDSWPSCKPDQVENMQQAFFEGGSLPEELCEPPEPMRSRVVDLASIGFEDQVRLLPEAVSLIEPEAPTEDFLAVKEQLRFFRALALWGWMLPLSLLGLIMAFAIRKWRDFGRWWGIPLLLGGLGTLFIAFIMSAVREELVSSWATNIIQIGPVREFLSTGFNALYGAGLRPLWVQGIIVVVGGIVLWFVGRRGKRTPSRPTGPEQSEPPHIATKIIEPSYLDEEVDDEGEPPSGIFG